MIIQRYWYYDIFVGLTVYGKEQCDVASCATAVIKCR